MIWHANEGAIYNGGIVKPGAFEIYHEGAAPAYWLADTIEEARETANALTILFRHDAKGTPTGGVATVFDVLLGEYRM